METHVAPRHSRLGLREQSWPTPRTAEYPAPPSEARRITGWNRKDWLAYVSTLVLDHVARRGHRHQGALRIVAAFDDSEHDEHLHSSSFRAETRSTWAGCGAIARRLSNCERKVSGWACTERLQLIERIWLRGVDLNHRPLGYEPNELPDCSTPQKNHNTLRG